MGKWGRRKVNQPTAINAASNAGDKMARTTEYSEAYLIRTSREKDADGEPTTEAQSAKVGLLSLHEGLTKGLAKKFAKKDDFPLEDAHQEAVVGFLIALDRFKEDKGCKLSTYAVTWIVQRLQRADPRNRNSITIPYHVTCELNQLHRADSKLRAGLGYTPSAAELAAELGGEFTEARVEKLLQIPEQPVSLDSRILNPEGADGGSLFEFVVDTLEHEEPQLTCIDVDMICRAQEVIDCLGPREQQLVKMSYGLAPFTHRHSVRDLAAHFNISRSAAWKALERAIHSTRRKLGVTPPPRNAELASRNARILQMSNDGANNADIGKLFAISSKRVRQILADQRRLAGAENTGS